jgi:hypothetical protein
MKSLFLWLLLLLLAWMTPAMAEETFPIRSGDVQSIQESAPGHFVLTLAPIRAQQLAQFSRLNQGRLVLFVLIEDRKRPDWKEIDSSVLVLRHPLIDGRVDIYIEHAAATRLQTLLAGA